jgi:type IV secretion system protein VirD4
MALATDHLALIRASARSAGGGIYLGAGSAGPFWGPSERSVLVLGPPRSGKTSCIVIPSVLAATGPVVCTSTKPEVMTRTAHARKRAGEVMLYDPSGAVERPNGVSNLTWSPVSACSRWNDAMLVAQLMVVASTAGASSRSAARGVDNHWHERSQALLATLLHAASIDGAPMSNVLGWVDRHQAGPAMSILDRSGNELAANLLGAVAMAEARELSSIWSTASGVLGAYHSDTAMATTTGDAFDARAWSKTGGTVYICASARHQNLVSPLVVALLSEIRTAAYERAARTDVGASPMLFALDEVANIAPLDDLPKQLSEGGGQGLLTLVCLQDMSQARARWGPEADGWLSLFGAKVVLPGIEDVRTLEMISSLAGQEEVVTRSVSTPTTTAGDRLRPLLSRLAGRGADRVSPAAPSITTSTVWRPRMPVDEISRGVDGMALLLDERSKMGFVKLTPWSEEPWLSVVNQGRPIERNLPTPSGPGLDLGR